MKRCLYDDMLRYWTVTTSISFKVLLSKHQLVKGFNIASLHFFLSLCFNLCLYDLNDVCFFICVCLLCAVGIHTADLCGSNDSFPGLPTNERHILMRPTFVQSYARIAHFLFNRK